jgi:hypothetical protein
MSKHTPRPWSYQISRYEPEAFDIIEPGIGALAIVKSEDYARLIAAAPDLLEALKLIASAENSALDLAYCKGIARAAIAKAEGQA